MGKKRVISSKSVAGKSGGRSFISSKTAKAFLVALVILVVASFIPAVSNQVKSLHKGMEASNIRKQIEEQRAERRRLIALKAEAMSPEQIGKAATRLGFIPMSARNIKGYELASDSAMPRNERVENRENPVLKTISSGVLGEDVKKSDLVLISDRVQKRSR